MQNGFNVELQSARWMQGHTSDRPSFNVLISKGFGERRFQVFAMTKGLLCLDKGPAKGGGMGGDEAANRAVMVGAVMGGALGAVIGAAVASNMSGPSRGGEERYDLCSEDELLDLAAQRKKSFVAFYDQISNISLDLPGFWGRTFGDGRTVGIITLQEKSVGKVAMEVRDASEMSVAIDSLPRRLGPRVQVNLQLDPRTHKFVAR
jgi:hypothetical protein